MNSGRKNGMLVGVGLLLAVAAVLLLSGAANATITGDSYSGSGNWVINQPTTLSGETLDVAGDINVYSTLTVTNASIRFTVDGAAFTVYGGAGGLTMSAGTGSTSVYTQDSDHFWYMEIQSTTSNVNVQGVTFTRIQDGVTITGGTALSRWFEDVTIIDAKRYGFRLLSTAATLKDVNVTVTGPGAQTIMRTIPAGQVSAILPQMGAAIPDQSVNGTIKSTSAYKVTSDLPIVAYQFNPLDNANVFSNDASLLIPRTAFDTDCP